MQIIKCQYQWRRWWFIIFQERSSSPRLPHNNHLVKKRKNVLKGAFCSPFFCRNSLANKQSIESNPSIGGREKQEWRNRSQDDGTWSLQESVGWGCARRYRSRQDIAEEIWERRNKRRGTHVGGAAAASVEAASSLATTTTTSADRCRKRERRIFYREKSTNTDIFRGGGIPFYMLLTPETVTFRVLPLTWHWLWSPLSSSSVWKWRKLHNKTVLTKNINSFSVWQFIVHHRSKGLLLLHCVILNILQQNRSKMRVLLCICAVLAFAAGL